MDENTGERIGLGVGFAGLAILVAGAFVPLRDELGGANMALVMVLIVVAAAAIGGRIAGATTALSAAVAFNFFYTKPYLTVRIDAARDILTVVLILAVGLAVGELGVARSRQSATRRSHLSSMRSLEQVGSLVSGGAELDEVWHAVRTALISTLGVFDAHFQAASDSTPIVELERDGRIDTRHKRYIGDGFALPEGGVALPVGTGGARLGQIVLVPNPEVGVTREQRRTAVAIADQFAIVLRRQPRVHSLS